MAHPITDIRVVKCLRVEAHAGTGTESDPHRNVVYLIDTVTGAVLLRDDPVENSAPGGASTPTASSFSAVLRGCVHTPESGAERICCPVPFADCRPGACNCDGVADAARERGDDPEAAVHWYSKGLRDMEEECRRGSQ